MEQSQWVGKTQERAEVITEANAARITPDSTVRTFAFRGVRPLIAGETLIVGGRVNESGQASVWAGNQGGVGQVGEIGFD